MSMMRLAMDFLRISAVGCRASALRDWRSGDFELALSAMLLPPVLATAHARRQTADLSPTESPTLAALGHRMPLVLRAGSG
jgi:hypothetical protein